MPPPSLDFSRCWSDLAGMKQLEFDGAIGERTIRVKLIQPQGASAGYQVLIDQWLQGTLVKRDHAWVAYLNRESIITGADIQILSELLDEGDQ